MTAVPRAQSRLVADEGDANGLPTRLSGANNMNEYQTNQMTAKKGQSVDAIEEAAMIKDDESQPCDENGD